MPLTHEQELWGMALWVEKTYGENGWLYIAQQQDRLQEEGDLDGVALSHDVAVRFDQLMEKTSDN